MSGGPRTIRELLQSWIYGLSLDESRGLHQLHQAIQVAIHHARELPPTLDARARDLLVQRLEEAAHWAMTCTSLAVLRKDREA